MIQSFYTLRLLAAELDSSLAGRTVGKPFSQTRSELVIPFLTGDQESDSVVRFSIGQQKYCFEDGKFARARRNVADLFGSALNKRVDSVSIAERDRCLFITMDDAWRIALALTGASANGYLIDNSGMIVEAFSDNDECKGEVFHHTRPAPAFPTVDDWCERLSARLSAGKGIASAVASSYAFFDRRLGREVIRRAGVVEAEIDSAGKGISESEMITLFEVARELDQELLGQPVPYVCRDSSAAWYLALHPLQQNPASGEDCREMPSVNAAIRTVLINGWRDDGFLSRVGPIRTMLGKVMGDRKRALGSLRKGLARPSRADQYQKWGDLLMAWQGTIDHATASVDVPDYYTGGTTRIPVASGQTRTELAELYYGKARKSRKRRETDEKRARELSREVDQITDVYEKACSVDSHSGWDEFESQYRKVLEALLPARTTGKETVPFRSYSLPGGYQVFVGRNAAQNDRLTTAFARKEDLWLHARGVPGSHTVLRVKGREEPPSTVIESAASIAAYHSKARGSALVPVIVVKKKYVRKPKGAQKGTVTVDRETVILVEPKIPVK